MTQAKSLPFRVTSIDGKARTVTGISSTWNLDAGGDLITQGAYAAWLARWQKDPFIVPLVDTHDYSSVHNVVGKMTDAHESAEGLVSTFELVEDDPAAEAVYRRMKGGFVTGLSIGYIPKRVRTPTSQQRSAGVVRIIDEIELHEISVVIFPMNTEAEVTGTRDKARSMEPDPEPLSPEAREAEARREAMLADLSAWEERRAREGEERRQAARVADEQRRERILAELERPVREAAAKEATARAVALTHALRIAEKAKREAREAEERAAEARRRRFSPRRVAAVRLN